MRTNYVLKHSRDHANTDMWSIP